MSVLCYHSPIVGEDCVELKRLALLVRFVAQGWLGVLPVIEPTLYLRDAGRVKVERRNGRRNGEENEKPGEQPGFSFT